jgi:hypothetical protein
MMQPQFKVRPFRRTRVVVVVLLSLFLTGTAVATLRAQSSNPFDAVIGHLEALSRSVEAMSDTLNQFVGAVSNPEPGPVMISTGLVRVAPGQTIDCHVANVSSQRIFVTFRAIRKTGLWTRSSANVEPGQGERLALAGVDVQGFYRCEFTFTGFANDVRGQLTVIGPGTGLEEGSAVATAEAR